MSEILPELKSFILPGGTKISSYCDISRTICRKTERQIVKLSVISDKVDKDMIKYFNRLSDYLFVLSRFFNYNETLWYG